MPRANNHKLCFGGTEIYFRLLLIQETRSGIVAAETGDISVVGIHSRRARIQTIWQTIYIVQEKKRTDYRPLRYATIQRAWARQLIVYITPLLPVSQVRFKTFQSVLINAVLVLYSWSIQSKAFFKSTIITPLGRPLSILTHKLSFVSSADRCLINHFHSQMFGHG